MTTDTETFSLPTSTAPSDVSDSTTCLPHKAPAMQSAPCPASQCPTASAAPPMPEWDTNIVPKNMFGQRFDPSADGSSSSGGSEFLYAAQEEMDGQQGPGKYADHENDGTPVVTVEEACKRSLNHFPCPGLAFPMPALEFDFRIAVKLNPETAHVEGGVTKEITTVAAGVWSGSFGHGRVIAGGYDLGQARGFRPMRLVEGAFVVQTSDDPPAVLEMRTRGSLSGPSDVLDLLLSPRKPKDIDPRRYGFRMFATIKTADKRYTEIVNCGLWVASGAWRGEHLIIDEGAKQDDNDNDDDVFGPGDLELGVWESDGIVGGA
ncbi:hypothetical protein G7046_g7266 [Stylonectria norvegica]|nr:hypothetical protein G7046_g7266 [Stylonectria norvegica]